MTSRVYIFLLILWGGAAYADQVDVKLLGLEGELLANAQARVSLYQKKTDDLDPHHIRYLHKQASSQIKRALEPFGFYHLVVNATLTAPDSDGGKWQAVYQVRQGEPVLLDRVTIEVLGEAKDDPHFVAFLQQQPLRAGQPLNHDAYEKTKKALINLANQQGYLDARLIQNEVKVRLQDTRADIDLVFDSGPQYCLAEVEWHQDQFSDAFMSKYLSFFTGDPYLSDSLLDLQANLAASGYFSKVNIHTRKSVSKPNCVDVIADLELGARAEYQARLGYGTDSGVRVGLDYGLRYLNRHGHQLNSTVGVSQNKNKHLAQLRYRVLSNRTRSRFFDATLDYRAEDFVSGDIDVEGVDGETRVVDLSLTLAQHHKRKLFNWDLEETIGVQYLTEEYELLPLLFTPEDQELLLIFVDENEVGVLLPDFKVLLLDMSWRFLQADDPMYSSSGQEVIFHLKGAKDGVASNVSFWQAHLDTEVIRRLHKRGRAILRASAAYTEVKTLPYLSLLYNAGQIPINANLIPKSLQFRTGGDNSVRGHEFEAISGGDQTLVAGKHLLTVGVEYEYRFLASWSASVFADAGNVFNDYSRVTLRKSAGFGIRWHSPVGLVRADIAAPIDDDEAENSFRFHLVIGPDF
ncbi:MAG: hypothetical protein CSA50_00130 [Gammaproteobacteria bacterium]|nr:MAG: hypothetical protein CSA50_00130 [Gammaproteobacteria bacterium]